MNSINSFNQSLLIAKYTYKEILKSRVVSNVFFLGLILMLISYVAAEFTFSVPQRVALDLGVGLVSFSAVGISLFMGVTLLSNEIHHRTIYMLLSRPITRRSYLFGRILGLSLILGLNIILLSVMTLIVFVFLGGHVESLFWWSLWFSFLESLIILNIVVLFSLMTNMSLSVLYAFVIYVVGHALEGTKETIFAKANAVVVTVLEAISYILPNLSLLNIKDYLLYDADIPLLSLLTSTGYGILYAAIIFCLTLYVFSKKDLN